MSPSAFGNTALGVTVMPEWFACEGVDAVLDRVQSIGATAIATSPYVLEAAPDGEGGREPPIDGGAGGVRPLDRPLFGRRELWVRTAPAFVHDRSRYADLRYQPTLPSPLTEKHADLLDRVFEVAASRGVEVLLQVMAASPPGYRVQFSGALADDECLGPDGKPVRSRVDRNASLASQHVRAYTAALVAGCGACGALSLGRRIPARLARVPAVPVRQRVIRFPSASEDADGGTRARPRAPGADGARMVERVEANAASGRRTWP
jgi:hypothetical protein